MAKEAPEWKNNTDPNVMYKGQETANYYGNLMQNGLPENLKKANKEQFERNMAGQLRGGESALRESYASLGGAPTGALLGGLVSQQSNSNNAIKDYYTNLLGQDFSAMNMGAQGMSGLQQMMLQNSGQQNMYDLQKYQIDAENRFNPAKLMGSIFQSGGNILGSYLTMKGLKG